MYTIISRFQWNDAKANLNALKHGISFKEATTVFQDINGLITEDQAHSQHERRQRLIGQTAEGRTLVVIFTMREGPVARLISARLANRKERIHYEKGR